MRRCEQHTYTHAYTHLLDLISSPLHHTTHSHTHTNVQVNSVLQRMVAMENRIGEVDNGYQVRCERVEMSAKQEVA